MLQVPLSSVPNQAVSFNVDGAYFRIHIYQTITHMCADIMINGATVESGVRCFVGIPLLQYPYMYEPNFGNFIFDSDVDWTNFGTSCNLYYLQKDELEQFEGMVTGGAAT